ncbi:hypothetical protein BDV93DRAFT_206317 [Ceratobasidium sp. AG-I]|nr:hypothetical protein BDV93DRAFT_206317 [Ceratobasidium sp. AG-I]
MLSVYTRPRSAVEECTRALSYWQDTHARLLPAIADYLNACACLHRALSQPALESSGSKLASALSCIDNSLPSLDQSALQLQNAQKTLRHLRNRSRMLAPINALPIEILTRIFDLAKSCVFHSYGSQSNPSRPSIGIISSVCSHWRKIALGASSLWNHIDLSIGKFRDANLALYAKESLNRAGNLPLYVHIEGGSEYQENHQRPVHLLAPFAQRIISLDLVLKANAAENIIRNIFRSGCGSSVQELYVCDEEWEEFDVLETGFDFLEWGGVPKDPLLPLKIFHLRGLLFEASSSVLKGLTELVLDPCTRHTQWAYSELHSVQNSAP